MQVRCPHCAHVFSTATAGIQTCPACSMSIDVPASEGGAPQGSLGAQGGVGGPDPFAPQGGGGAPTDVRADTPWEDRERLGLVQGLWQTWTQSVLKPQAFWPTVKPDGSLGSALGFGWITYALAMAVGLPFLLLQLPMMLAQYKAGFSQVSGSAEMIAMLESVSPVAMAVGYAVTSLLVWPVMTLIYISIVHVSALLLNAGGGGFNATARAFYYAQGPNVASAIPIGGTLTALYAFVLFGWGMKELHGTTPGKAALAILLPVIVFACCMCLGGIAFAGVIAAAMGASSQ